MRSRYSAFAVGDSDYLLRTWHRSTRPDELNLDDGVRWTHLEILGSQAGGLFDDTGTVEFRAHHRQSGRRGVLHERSEFERDNGLWFYVRGSHD
jgi:SEC-C motif-containing protein